MFAVSLGSAYPRACGMHTRVHRSGPEMQKVVYRVCKTATDIKRMWDHQRTEAALRGTWMHLQIEPPP